MIETKTLKAGAIILSNLDNSKIALLHRGKQNDWSFPKGHIEEGEQAFQTMHREIKEETGLEVVLIKELPDLEYNHTDSKLISTKMYLVESKDDSTLKLESEDDNIQWVDYLIVKDKLSYENLKIYFISVFPIIKNIITS